MNDDNGVMKFLKWAGIAALVAIPVVVYLRNRREEASSAPPPADDADIFAAELEE